MPFLLFYLSMKDLPTGIMHVSIYLNFFMPKLTIIVYFGMRIACAHWVSRLLTPEQMQTRIICCWQFEKKKKYQSRNILMALAMRHRLTIMTLNPKFPTFSEKVLGSSIPFNLKTQKSSEKWCCFLGCQRCYIERQPASWQHS